VFFFASPENQQPAMKRKTPKKRPAARKRAPAKKRPAAGETQTQIARRLSVALKGPVTRECVRDWIAKGYPLDDPEALAIVLLDQHKPADWLVQNHATPPAGETVNVADLRIELLIAKVRKTAAEAVIKEIEAEAAKEKYQTKEEAREAGRQIAAVFRSHQQQLENNLPPILEGLTAAQMRPKIRTENTRIMKDHDRLMIEMGARRG
jgi:hypothetical protein